MSFGDLAHRGPGTLHGASLRNALKSFLRDSAYVLTIDMPDDLQCPVYRQYPVGDLGEMHASRITGRNPNSQAEVFVQVVEDAASWPRFDHGSDADQRNGFRIVRLEVRT